MRAELASSRVAPGFASASPRVGHGLEYLGIVEAARPYVTRGRPHAGPFVCFSASVLQEFSELGQAFGPILLFLGDGSAVGQLGMDQPNLTLSATPAHKSHLDGCTIRPGDPHRLFAG